MKFAHIPIRLILQAVLADRIEEDIYMATLGDKSM